tara:strand:+ start:1345 stop:3360 length:2016 start_codon:yes stop_codon:yes gene_type:complete
MAPKRKSDSEVLMYFVDAVARMWDSKDPAVRNVDLCMKGAQAWGETMVSAELQAMRQAGNTADERFQRLVGGGAKGWYARGVRFYLDPNSPDAPGHLGEHRAGLLPSLARQPVHQLRNIAQDVANKWMGNFQKTTLYNDAQHERNVEAANAIKAPKAPGNARVAPQPAAKRPVNATAKAIADGPLLPPALGALLRGVRHEELVAPNAPRPCMRAQVEKLLHDQRILCAQEGEGVRALTMRACAFQMQLEARGFGALFGNGTNEKEDDQCLRNAGLQMLKRGGFNSIYTFRSNAPTDLLSLMPAELRGRMSRWELVLRVPLTESRWLTFDEMVGEVHNLVFTACSGIGPPVAAIAIARKVSKYKSRTTEGAVMVLYKAFIVLEKATRNAEERYAASTTTMPAQLATHKPYYLHALIATVYQMSREGYVHLDATLRNFVDFYPTTLGRAARDLAVKIIDVDAGVFRRLRPTACTDWQSLFLFNLLYVLCCLKVCLADRWDLSLHWYPVRACVDTLLARLPESDSCIATGLRWTGTFSPQDLFPDVIRGALAGDTDAAAIPAANAFLRHYLLHEPLTVALTKYLDRKPSTAAEAAKAKQWYDAVYRAQMLPSMRFFLAKLAPQLGVPPRRFVNVAHEFLATPHKALQHQYLPKVPTADAHHPNTPRDLVLGLVL